MGRKQHKPDAAAAVNSFLHALGVSDREDVSATPQRVAELWHDHLLAGERANLAEVLGTGIPAPNSDTVSLLGLDVHLVCPHHLTVAFGQAHLAYLPGPRVAPFGRLVELVSACTSRLILQEACGGLVVNALAEHLEVRAAVCAIDATHPCHNVTKPKAHRSRVLTWAATGPAEETRELRELVLAGLRES